jgi:hypothetical protein
MRTPSWEIERQTDEGNFQRRQGIAERSCGWLEVDRDQYKRAWKSAPSRVDLAEWLVRNGLRQGGAEHEVQPKEASGRPLRLATFIRASILFGRLYRRLNAARLTTELCH